MASRNWTRDELLLAMNLYCQLPFSKLHQHNPEIIQLASAINRTPSSVAMKLSNLASLDRRTGDTHHRCLNEQANLQKCSRQNPH